MREARRLFCHGLLLGFAGRWARGVWTMSRSWTQSIFGGKPPDPKEQVKQWRLKLKGEMRTLQVFRV